MAISRKPHDKDARSRVLELAEALVEHPDLQADIRQCHELFREAHSEREHRENLHAQLDESSHEMFNALGIYFDPVHIVEEAVDWLLLRYQPIWDRMTSAPATPDANIHADASTNDAPATPDANIHADASTNDLLDRRNIAIALEYAVEGGEWRASLPPLRASLDERYGYPNPSYVDIRRRQYDQAGQIVERNYWTSETPKPDDAGYTVTVMLRHNATVEDARRAFRETLRRMEGSLDHAPDAGLPRGRPTEFATHVALYRER